MRRLLLILIVFVAVAAAPLHAAPDPRRVTPVVEVFESTRGSVVNISSTQVIEVRSPFGLGGLFDFGIDRDFGRFRGRQIRRTSVGSGFVLHEAGYIVTNAHVVARTAERKVIFADGAEFDAEIVALDEPHDLAILKIDPAQSDAGPEERNASGASGGEGPGGSPSGPRQLTPINLGVSSDLMVGETVIAIGNPLGYQHTVTAGVVSAVDRELPIDQERSLTGLIQTDASINPGNSGGPLLNALGELVGINTAIRADAQNIGFAIPVDHLRELLPAMLDVERRYDIVTGLSVRELPPTGDDGRRLRITAVEPGTPAAAAGLDRWGDALIEAVDDEPVRSMIDYLIALIGRTPGEVIELTLRTADGAREVVRLTLAERPRPDGAALLLGKLGLEATPIDPAAIRQMGISRLRGLIVTAVQLNGPADRAGLEPGDILIQLGRHQPTTLDEVGELLEPVTAGDRVEIAILRIAGRTIYRAGATLVAR